MMIGKNAYVCSLVILVLAACGSDTARTTAETADKPNAEAIQYDWHEANEQAPDEDSPVGYWEKQIKIPQFSSENPALELDVINSKLKELAKEHQCSGGGDHAYTVEVHWATERLISMTYEVMWLCETMPGPDSRSGVLNLIPGTAKDVNFVDEIVPGKLDELRQLIVNDIAKQSGSSSDTESCGPESVFNAAYAVDDGIAFSALGSEHGAEGCTVVLSRDRVKDYFVPGSAFTSP